MEKTIHQIWLGPRPFPEKFLKWQQSWRDHFPDWEYLLWGDAEVADILPQLICREALPKVTNFGMKADLIRLEILRLIGGLYVDVDFECFRRFDFLPHDCFCYADELKHRPGNAFLASPSGHPFLSAMLHGVRNALDTPGAFSRDPVKATGPESLHRALQPWGDPWKPSAKILTHTGGHVGDIFGRIAVFKQSVFYPYSWKRESVSKWRESIARGTVNQDYPEAYAAHHWEKSWA